MFRILRKQTALFAYYLFTWVFLPNQMESERLYATRMQKGYNGSDELFYKVALVLRTINILCENILRELIPFICLPYCCNKFIQLCIQQIHGILHTNIRQPFGTQSMNE